MSGATAAAAAAARQNPFPCPCQQAKLRFAEEAGASPAALCRCAHLPPPVITHPRVTRLEHRLDEEADASEAREDAWLTVQVEWEELEKSLEAEADRLRAALAGANASSPHAAELLAHKCGMPRHLEHAHAALHGHARAVTAH